MKTIRQLTKAQLAKDDYKYSYQPDLVLKLDNLDSDFTQEIINEIVLWKVNRYASLDRSTLNMLNQIDKKNNELDSELTKLILHQLLGKNQRGIRLAMASTILRFKNPSIYQIIDQRVYRFIYGSELSYSESDIAGQIELYINYLERLKEECKSKGIEYRNADRIIYSMDKFYNSKIKLKGY